MKMRAAWMHDYDQPWEINEVDADQKLQTKPSDYSTNDTTPWQIA